MAAALVEQKIVCKKERELINKCYVTLLCLYYV